jgi:hypothetical protein
MKPLTAPSIFFLLIGPSCHALPTAAQTCGINGATPGMIGGCLTTPSYGQPTYRLQTSPVNRGVILVEPSGPRYLQPTPSYTVPQITPIWSR